MKQEEIQQMQEQHEQELRGAIDRVNAGLGGVSEGLILASALGLSQSTDNTLGDTE